MDEVEKLIFSLKSEKVETRRDSAYLLGDKGDSRAIQALSQALEDNDFYVRERARDSLRQLDVLIPDDKIEHTFVNERFNDWFKWSPRWLVYGVLAAVASLIALGFQSISDGNCLGMFWGFGFVAPAAILEILIFGIEGSGVVTEYFILSTPVIWFVIGAVIGKIISLPSFESIDENSKIKISAVIILVLIVLGFLALIMIGLGM